MLVRYRPLQVLAKSARLTTPSISTNCPRIASFHTSRNSLGDTSSMASIIDKVKTTVAENFGGASHAAVSKEDQFSIDEVPDLSGKVIQPHLPHFL